MQKTLDYLHQKFKSTDDREIKWKIALIWEKLHIADEWWDFYFKLSIDSSMNRVNENVIIWVFVNIASVTDIIYKWWSWKTISYKNWSKLELVCLLRNHFVHWAKSFHLPMWSADEKWLTDISLVHLSDIDKIRWLKEWKMAFENENKEDWWDEEWAISSKNQIIQNVLDIHKNDIEIIDNELYEMVSVYFNTLVR